MSPGELGLQMAVFAVGVIVFWWGLVPLTFGTIEWIFDIGGIRRRQR